MAKKAEFVFVGDADSVIRAAKAAQRAVAKTASETEGSSRKIAAADARNARSAERAGRQVEGAHVRVRKSFAGMTASAAKMGAGVVAAYASIEGAKKAVEATESLAHSTLTLNKSFGLAVHTASEWAAVAQARGADGKALTMGFKALSTATHAASEGGKAQVKAFGELGISHKELQKHGGDLNWVLHSVADGLQKMPVGTDKAAISAKLFGRTWTTIAPLIRNGSDALDEQLQLADKYGATFDEKGVGSLEAFIKAQREAKLATLGLQVAFGTQLAPALTKVIKAGSNFAAQMRDGTGAGGKFAAKAKQVWTQLQPLRDIIASTGKYLGEHPRLILAVVAAFAGFKVLKTVGAGFTALNAIMAANPYVLVGAGLLALGAGLVVAYKKSETFRKIVDASFRVVRVAAADMFDVMTFGAKVWLTAIGKIAGAASHVPGLGWLKKVSNAALGAADELDKISDKIRGIPGHKAVKISVLAEITGADLSPTLQKLLGRDSSASPDDRGSVVGKKPPVKLKKADGGIVPGQGNGDTVPAWLTPGEHVTRKKIVEQFGPTVFNDINEGRLDPRFGYGDKYTGGGIVSRADAIAGKYPYVWGGGHGKSGVPSGGPRAKDAGQIGYDCSGAISAALGVSPRVSGQFMGFGLPGPGSPNDTKLYANAQHVFGVFNGRGWGTGSPQAPDGGAGWLPYNSRTGFTVRHLEDGGQKGETGTVGDDQETSVTGASTKTEKAEKAGSRIVNAVAKPFFAGSKGITALNRFAAGRDRVIGEADTAYGQAVRRFDQSEENLGTAAGRGKRIDEISELRKLKTAQLKRQQAEREALEAAAQKYAGLIKALRAKLAGKNAPTGVKAARIRKRIKDYDDQRIEKLAAARALGSAITDTQLDIGDLNKELGDVAATPDDAGPGADAAPSASDAVSQALSDIDLQERAGVLTPEQARGQRIEALTNALNGANGPLDQRQIWEIMAQLRDVQQQTVEATSGLTDAIKALTDETAKQNALSQSELGIGLREARRFFADWISGQVGSQIGPRRLLPGTGELSRL